MEEKAKYGPGPIEDYSHYVTPEAIEALQDAAETGLLQTLSTDEAHDTLLALAYSNWALSEIVTGVPGEVEFTEEKTDSFPSPETVADVVKRFCYFLWYHNIGWKYRASAYHFQFFYESNGSTLTPDTQRLVDEFLANDGQEGGGQ